MQQQEYTPTTIGGEGGRPTSATPITSSSEQPPSSQRDLFNNPTANASYGAIMAVLSSPQYLALAGFIIIAAMGHILDWKAWGLYVSFLVVISMYTAAKTFLEKTIDVFRAGVGWKSIRPLSFFLLLGIIIGILIVSIKPSIASWLHDTGSSTVQKIFSTTEKDSSTNPSELGE